MSSLRKFLRRIRTILWTSLTLVMLLAAVLVGVGKLLMPYSVSYQPQLEAWLSKTFNQPVKIESFDGEWKAFGPQIRLQGLTLKPEGMQSAIAISQAALDIKPLNVLIPGRPLYSFRIIGADLALERTVDGRYLLSGFGVNNRTSGSSSNSGLRNVALDGEVRLQDVSLSLDDPEREIHLVLTNVNGRLKLDGSNMAAEIQARVSDRNRRRVVGDLEAVVQVKLDAEQHLADARWHVQTGELMLADLVRQLPHHPLLPVSGRLNAEVWGQWQKDSPQEMQGVLDLRDAQLSSLSGPLIIEHLNSRLNFQFMHRNSWRLDLSDLTVDQGGHEWRSRRLSVARDLPADIRLWVSSDYLRLDFPLQLTQRIMASYNTQWPTTLPRRAQGSIQNLDLVLDARWRVKMAEGQIENGRFWDWEKGPDIAGLNLQVAMEAGAGHVSFAGPSVTLDWPRVFRRPLTFAMTDCRLGFLWSEKRDWQFDLQRCQAENEDISVNGRVRMAASEGKPEVDINVEVERGDISRFGDYWPENVMKERTRHWLRTSLLGGDLSHGRFSMVGDLDDLPFANNIGRLQATAPVTGVVLKYANNWPQAEQVDALVQFEGPGIHVQGQIGDTGGAMVGEISAHIGNFKRPVLDVEFKAQTEIAQLISYIKQTPMLDTLTLDPEQFVVTGNSETHGQIHVGLGASKSPLQVSGGVAMQQVQFTELTSGVVLDEISGVLNFTREGLSADQMDSTYKGNPVGLDIIADWDADEVFRASLQGELPIDHVVPEDLRQREPLFKRASGTSRWDINLSVAANGGGEGRETWLELNSDLEGVTIDLPAPMAKPESASWPLMVRYPITTNQRLLTADLPGRLQLKMELTKDTASPVSAVIGLGEDAGALPASGTFVIAGKTPMLNLDGWLDLAVDRFKQTEEVGGLVLKSARVAADQTMIFNRIFADVGLSMNYQDAVIHGDFDAVEIDGNIRYYKNEEGSHSLTGEFDRLIIPDPVDEGMTMESDPAELPEMHFFSKEFSYMGLELGETRIEGYPLRNGFHMESIKAQSPGLAFNARGDWLKDDLGERSDFDIHITSEDLGTLLEAMDISSAMQGGQTVLNFDAGWRGPPAAFALERLSGEMDISIVQGNILTADSGAGRMLGLLSLSELPRRLAMDFRDVFDEGFSFDQAGATMRLENGASYTDDLKLSSTAAEISIVGTTNLAAQTFDYELVVRPGVGKTLPVLGAITGGPAGAAAGLALQGLLGESLGNATAVTYSVSGPWADPIVERVDELIIMEEPVEETQAGELPADGAETSELTTPSEDGND